MNSGSPGYRTKVKSTNYNSWIIKIISFLLLVSLFVFVTIYSHSQLGNLEEEKHPFVSNSYKTIINLENEFVRLEVSAIDKLREELQDIPKLNEITFDKIASWEESFISNGNSLIDIGKKDFYNIEEYLFSKKESAHTSPPSEDNSLNNNNNNNELENLSSVDPSMYHTLTCPHADLMTFWKPPTLKDLQYKTPFINTKGGIKYVTFEPDVGGWNNIRMQMELVLVFAAATGRTLVLPPDQPMYLLNQGKGHQKAHSFADFFPFDFINKRFPVISMEEFMQREAVTGNLVRNDDNSILYPPGNKTEFIGTDKIDRNLMWDYLRNVSECPLWKCMKEFVVIPPSPGLNVSLLPPIQSNEYKRKLDEFGAGRKPNWYDDYLQNKKIIHFISKPGLGYRLLEHFYTFIHFEDPKMDRFYKRFVRDYVHYIDIIFCKAGIIVDKLLKEGQGKFSTFHIRRGEFQYKEVKIPANQMLENIGEFIPANELIFIATDEKNKSFFKDFRNRWPNIRFLDDYMETADLYDINPNYLG